MSARSSKGRRATALVGLCALGLTLALAAPAPAGAAEPTGSTTLVLAAGKQKLLKKRGIAFGGARGVEVTGRESRLQIVGGQIGDTAAVFSHEGALRLTARKGRGGHKGKGRRRVLLLDPRVELGPRSILSAKPNGKRRRAIFDLKAPAGRLLLNPTAGTAQLLGARLVWRRSAARTLSRKLGAKLPRGRLGALRTRAAILLDGPPQPPGEIDTEPPLLARPASALDVTGGALTWHVRDSWVRYVGSEVAEPIEGAVPEPAYPGNQHPCPDNPVPTNPTLVYSYELPFASGWYDPPTGTTALYYSGGVRFAYPSRGIDLTLRNPEIEIAGAASRAIFRLRGAGDTPYPDKRAAVMSLGVTAPPVEAPSGSFAFGDELKATLTPDGETVFGGFYAPPNNGFGCFSVAFSTGG